MKKTKRLTLSKDGTISQNLFFVSVIAQIVDGLGCYVLIMMAIDFTYSSKAIMFSKDTSQSSKTEYHGGVM